MQFGAKDIPSYQEETASYQKIKYVKRGKDNKFPDYLLNLVRKSPKHGALIKGKSYYVAGKGFEFKGEENKHLNKALKVVNRYGESLNKILKKIALDQEITNGFFLQIIWSKGGLISDILHVEDRKVRTNEDNSMFYIKSDWSKTQGSVLELPAFNPDERSGSSILYFKEYAAGVESYSCPDYLSSQNYIEADILVSKHVLNNANSGFTPSKMIVFHEGDLTDEQQRDIERRLKAKYTGEDGSKIIVAFATNAQMKPEIIDLGASDMSKENFDNVERLISQNIFTGHQITSPMLFGVKTEGQLGGRSEIRESYEILKNTYINARQQNIEEVLNMLMSIQGLPEGAIVPVEPIGYSLEEIKEYAPKAYILDKLGINPDEWESDEEKEEKEEVVDEESDDEKKKTVKEKLSENNDDDLTIELFSERGEPRENFFVYHSKKITNPAALNLSEDADAIAIALAEITQLESNVLDQIKKDKRATPDVIAKALGVDIDLVKRLLSELSERGMIRVSTEKSGSDRQVIREITDGGREAVKEKRPTTHDVLIRYSYEGIRDERNRDFCRRMLDLNKIYSRAEIEQVSMRLGYSVWERRGGFYTNPNTGETTPYCRHHWAQQIVIRKK
jgi:DNA-binding MarR family transcriptional regulator